ncbi:MAG: hypothetical protein RMM53_06285 [Bacteroidia bacterium]|nr:hypothetical protein [Bacteroidia bacterium]MDW8333804.1 hypothetical protein [Bacteroidia bacterium]
METLGAKWEPYRQKLLRGDVADLDKCRILFTLAANFRQYLDEAKRALSAAPNDSRFGPYKAAIWALEAKYTPWPMDKLLHVNRATEKLDALVARRPEDVETRFIRAMVCHRLPAFFNRKTQAIADFEYVLKHLDRLQNPEFEAFVVEYVSEEVKPGGNLARMLSELRAKYAVQS